MREFLPTLSGRQKWRRESENVRVGYMVVVVSPDTRRGQWPVGRVVDAFPRSGNCKLATWRRWCDPAASCARSIYHKRLIGASPTVTC